MSVTKRGLPCVITIVQLNHRRGAELDLLVTIEEADVWLEAHHIHSARSGAQRLVILSSGIGVLAFYSYIDLHILWRLYMTYMQTSCLQNMTVDQTNYRYENRNGSIVPIYQPNSPTNSYKNMQL